MVAADPLRGPLNPAVEAVKAELLKWVIRLFIAQVGLFAALIKLLH